MDTTSRRLTIIAVLIAVILPLGDLWMSLTTYSYAKLHLFILAPLALLYLVPPRPLSNVHPGVRQFGYTMMLVLAVVAVVYCVAGWDRILYQTGVIICTNSYGRLFGVPYEEWFWCVDHTVLACLWVMSIWHSRPVPQTRRSGHIGFRVGSSLVCLALAYYGYILQGHGKKYFYLGLTLLHTFPIFALHFATVGHFYLQCPCECILGILVPSVYVIGVDTFAIYKGIWQVSEEFAIGSHVLGIRTEHIVIYTLTTALASQAMVGFLRTAETYQAIRKRTGSSIKSVALSYSRGY